MLFPHPCFFLQAQRHKAERLSAMYAANAEACWQKLSWRIASHVRRFSFTIPHLFLLLTQYARMIEEQAAEHERKVKEREEAFRALQEKEMAIARQIARESAAFRAQSEALQEVRTSLRVRMPCFLPHHLVCRCFLSTAGAHASGKGAVDAQEGPDCAHFEVGSSHG